MKMPEASDLVFGGIIIAIVALTIASVYGAAAGDVGMFLGGVTANCCIAAGCMLFTLATVMGRRGDGGRKD